MINTIKKESYLMVFLFFLNFLSQFYLHIKELTVITLLLIAILHARITIKILSWNSNFLDKKTKIIRNYFIVITYLTFLFAYLFRVL